ncbi:MAG: endonuclease [Thermotogae bacterium]|uniref:endonuclease III domain-containing protein n=1 Tax=Kosmotoga sp. TaxID=1955248 RepID=UPI000F234293|nr:endonuclease [Kosmotoga sp.]MBO8166014.1 endonuclease [Kosmotoga sp.]MCD6159259.1 endonuclease [Kosmotoga sp.]RKX48234.1 MAG: endonuclease [Thermotogota bacterium]
MEAKKALEEIFKELHKHYNPHGWWPAETPFEVAVGAVLTQSTNWHNVEKAIRNLKKLKVLLPEGLYELQDVLLQEAIKPAGFHTRKSKAVKAVAKLFLSLNAKDELLEIRKKLLSIKGIGKETADSILLYALEKPIFVVDAYTFRFLERYGIETSKNYDKVQALFHNAFQNDVNLFREFHALIVEHSKTLCKKKPDCEHCFLKKCKRATVTGAL